MTTDVNGSNSPHTHQQSQRQDVPIQCKDAAAKYTPACSPSQLYLLALIICLIGTQMVMLIATKKVMTVAPFPLLLCEAQFLVSSVSSGALILMRKQCCKTNNPSESSGASSKKATSWTFYLPLSLSWTLGFVLFNASATFMSPSYVNLVRCGEPLATVLVGWIVFGKRYAGRVLVTLIPVLGGVILASPSGGAELSLQGIVLAGLSNVCFCIRPFVLHAMKQKQKGTGHHQNNNKAKNQDDLHTFFLVTTLATFIILPGLVWLLEGSLLEHYYGSLYSKIVYQDHFKVHILEACLGFFAYQYTQLRVMSLTSPLAFSILTPVIKAVMIVLCSLYFGDILGLRQIVGVLTTTSGGYWFTKTKMAMTVGSNAGKAPNGWAPAPILPVHSPCSKEEPNGTVHIPHDHSS